MSETVKGIEFVRVDNCVNGNPRYIFHPGDFAGNPNFKGYGIDRIVTEAKSMGAKQYRKKYFNNYLVIASYNLLFFINKLLKNLKN